MPGPTLDVATIDRLVSDLLALKAALVAADEKAVDEVVDEVVEPVLIDTASASSRFGLAPDSVRWLCREKKIGTRIGGRWMVNVAELRKHVSRKAEQDTVL
ncbi:hypothetical protein [Aurantimonas sp. 22II-16-19i]|uniref:hypothetical protein n=1 Tax=Aurantimonas sp. 22II-16-19i TaxID=1317114 RepID=UPI0009F7C523|nr:hypothetical protein [Aurantimonas sp. 22II-16-19i]ORE97469.1 hypothetical protein ATO4_09122 [Aurantimonas sp. 22II-16-19i]